MNRPNIAVMLALALGVWTLLHAYIHLRLVRHARLAGRASVAAWTVLVANWLVAPVSMFLTGGPDPVGPAAWMLAWIGYSAVGLIGLVFPFVLVRDLLWLAAWVVRILPRDPARAGRAFNASSAAVAVLAGACAIAAAVIGALPPRVVATDLPIAGLPAELEGYRIAFYSDLHLGAVGRRSLSEAVRDRVNALDPDLAVLGGDLADGMASALAGEAAPLGEVRARDGRFFVTGNHEYFRDLPGWLAEVKRLGYTTLTNEYRVIRRGKARLLVAGIPDYHASSWFGIPSAPDAAARGAPRCDVRILLSHNPIAAPEAALAGYDLQVSGHSHGGQFFPWTLVFGNLPWYPLGLHPAGRMLLFVSSGAGSWGPPFRLGTRTEVNLLRLVRAAAPAGQPRAR